MEMIAVTSSNVEAIGYDENSQTLQIIYKNGATYQYFDVHPQIFDDLRNANSIGAYLASNIKGVYRYSRV